MRQPSLPADQPKPELWSREVKAGAECARTRSARACRKSALPMEASSSHTGVQCSAQTLPTSVQAQCFTPPPHAPGNPRAGQYNPTRRQRRGSVRAAGAAAVALLLQADVEHLVAHHAAVHGCDGRPRALIARVIHKSNAPALAGALIQHHLRQQQPSLLASELPEQAQASACFPKCCASCVGASAPSRY